MAIKESEYSKSVSSYVIREEHQNTDKGKVYERDITTIGGRNYSDKYKRPVYRSSNFIITTSNETANPLPPTETVWDKNAKNEESWTWEDVEDITPEEDSSTSITLKPDVYSLKSFAYFGSCSELLRVSINNITTKFPGELFATDQKLYYVHKDDKNTNGEYRVLGGDDENEDTENCIFDNPFYVNLHSEFVDNYNLNKNPLKYFFANGFYKTNYIAIDPKDNKYDITDVEYTAEEGCVSAYKKGGELTIKLKPQSGGDEQQLKLSMYVLPGDDYVYLTSLKNRGWHIRPISEYYDDFKSSLSTFEKVLLSEDTLPKYSPSFEVYSETDYGHSVQLQQFTFPMGFGDYNLGVNTMQFEAYVNRLSKIAEYYDEFFCDNLYRSMTHEAIKNFDWSYKRDIDDSLTSSHVEGGSKIQKLIRIIGREFDDIKLYIDGIKHANKLSYGNSGSLPDYFLTDFLDNEGWDYKDVIPFDDKLNQYADSIKPYDMPSTTDECDGKEYELEPIKTYNNEIFECTPYDINNHFIKMLSLNSKSIWRKKGCISAIESILSLFGLKRKKWVEDISEERDKFQDTVKESCPNIEDAETTLCENREKFPKVKDAWDYEIYEYTYQGIKKELTGKEREAYLKVNNNKFIAYNEDAYIDRQPTPWRGLLVKEFIEKKNVDGEDIITNCTLFPWYERNRENDGSPYYQMYGGWLNKEISVSEDDELISKPQYSETIPNIRGVRDIKELLKLPINSLNDGDICYVADLSRRYAIIDGITYELRELKKGDQTIPGWYYFETEVYSGSFVVGQQIYSNSVTVLQPDIKWDDKLKKYTIDDQEENKNFVQTLPIESYKDGSTVQIFVRMTEDLESNVEKYSESEDDDIVNKSDKRFMLSDKYGVQPDLSLIISPRVFGYNIKKDDLNCAKSENCSEDFETTIDTKENKKPTHYFKLNNKHFSRQLHVINAGTNNKGLGWVQLTEDSNDYKYAKSLKKYYNGNNPHGHEVESDSGREYLNYFIQLFKHAIENELFDYNELYNSMRSILGDNAKEGTSLYDINSQSNLIDWINNFGFDGIGDDCKLFEASKKMDYKLWYADKKNDGYWLKFPEEDDRSESVINTKFVDIVFNCDNDCKTVSPKLKYLDKVVIPYLSQVLPSTLIIKIRYTGDPCKQKS